MKSLFSFDGKVAVITGAAQGVGAATANVLAKQGARVAMVDYDMPALRAAVRKVGRQAKGYKIDLSDIPASQRMIRSVHRHFGRIDILVNVAGICPRLPFLAATPEDWEKIFNVNARSQYFLCQAVCPIMKQQGGGRIINVTSTAGRTGTFTDASIYSGTKGAIAMFSKSIAREVAADNILVNTIAPGVLDTRMMAGISNEKRSSIERQIPVGRMGKPEEIAHCIAFIASDECSYATGASFDINGGWLMI